MTHGPKPVVPDVLAFKDMSKAFVSWINPPGSAAKDFDAEGFLLDCLSGRDPDGPYLFVFDNFETVRNAVDDYATIDAHVRLPNKVLITSRFRDFKGDYPSKFAACAGLSSTHW